MAVIAMSSADCAGLSNPSYGLRFVLSVWLKYLTEWCINEQRRHADNLLWWTWWPGLRQLIHKLTVFTFFPAFIRASTGKHGAGVEDVIMLVIGHSDFLTSLWYDKWGFRYLTLLTWVLDAFVTIAWATFPILLQKTNHVRPSGQPFSENSFFP